MKAGVRNIGKQKLTEKGETKMEEMEVEKSEPQKLETENQEKLVRKKREEIEQQLLDLPIVQYAWLSEEDIPFSDHVREICRKECPRYGKSWSCPPGVGTVKECQGRCSHFSEVFVFTTIAEVADIDNLEETLATRPEHEAVTKKVQEVLRPYFGETLALSAQSCEICEKCAYPDGPCRYPDQMMPCVEGYGIVVLPLEEKAGIEFMNGAGIVTWFGMVLLAEE